MKEGGQLASKVDDGEHILGTVPGLVSANGCPGSSRDDDDVQGPLIK
jgi:hypothetical protein